MARSCFELQPNLRRDGPHQAHSRREVDIPLIDLEGALAGFVNAGKIEHDRGLRRIEIINLACRPAQIDGNRPDQVRTDLEIVRHASVLDRYRDEGPNFRIARIGEPQQQGYHEREELPTDVSGE